MLKYKWNSAWFEAVISYAKQCNAGKWASGRSKEPWWNPNTYLDIIINTRKMQPVVKAYATGDDAAKAALAREPVEFCEYHAVWRDMAPSTRQHGSAWMGLHRVQPSLVGFGLLLEVESGGRCIFAEAVQCYDTMHTIGSAFDIHGSQPIYFTPQPVLPADRDRRDHTTRQPLTQWEREAERILRSLQIRLAVYDRDGGRVSLLGRPTIYCCDGDACDDGTLMLTIGFDLPAVTLPRGVIAEIEGGVEDWNNPTEPENGNWDDENDVGVGKVAAIEAHVELVLKPLSEKRDAWTFESFGIVPCPIISYPGNDHFDYWNLSDGQLHHELVMHEVFLTEAVEACSREYPGERSYYGPVAYTPDFSGFE